MDARFGDFLAIVGHNRVRSTPLLADPNQKISDEAARDAEQQTALPANQLLTTLAWKDS